MPLGNVQLNAMENSDAGNIEQTRLVGVYAHSILYPGFEQRGANAVSMTGCEAISNTNLDVWLIDFIAVIIYRSSSIFIAELTHRVYSLIPPHGLMSFPASSLLPASGINEEMWMCGC